MYRIHDKIRMALEARSDLTQKGLAERMGLNPAAVNRMLHGQRNVMADEIPIIESYLGVKFFTQDPTSEFSRDKKQRRGFADSGRQNALPSPIPVYRLGAEEGFTRKDAVDLVQRHPAQGEVRDAFAIYVFSGEMEPRYLRGELVYIHPGKPPEAGRDVMIVPKKGGAFLARLVRESAGKLRVLQLNPVKEREIPIKGLRAVYAIVGRG